MVEWGLCLVFVVEKFDLAFAAGVDIVVVVVVVASGTLGCCCPCWIRFFECLVNWTAALQDSSLIFI